MIEEANNISTLKIEELIGNLMSFEVQMIGRRETKASEKKSMAFNTLTDGSDSNSDNDEKIAFMTRNIQKFLKYRKMNNLKRNNYKNSGNQNVVPNNKIFQLRRTMPYQKRLPVSRKAKSSYKQ